MRRLDGPLAAAVAILILFLLAAAVETFGLIRRLFRRLGWLGFEGASSREEQDGWTFV